MDIACYAFEIKQSKTQQKEFVQKHWCKKNELFCTDFLSPFEAWSFSFWQLFTRFTSEITVIFSAVQPAEEALLQT